MFRRVRLLALLLAIAAPAAAQTDDLDLHQVVVHSAPDDVADWPVTVTIAQLELASDGAESGVKVTAAIPDAWNFHVPGWGDPAFSDAQKASCSVPAIDNGCVLYTVWPVVNVGGQWHTAGIIQIWRGRAWTGAPLLTSWHDWAYAPDRWGAMVDYRPAAGDRVGFFVTAGDARGPRGVTSRRERSNVVVVPLAPRSSVTFPIGPGHVDPPVDPPPPPPDSSDLVMIRGQLEEILGRLTAIDTRLDALGMREDATREAVDQIRAGAATEGRALLVLLKTIAKQTKPKPAAPAR